MNTWRNQNSTALSEVVRSAARTGQPDLWISALLAPSPVAFDLAAIAALAAELASIAELTHEPVMGQVRLQWWRETLSVCRTGALSGHPIADAVSDVVRRRELPITAIEKLIDAHEFDISGELLPDDSALDDYLASTNGLTFALGAAVLIGPNAAAHGCFREAGIAYGLARRLGRLAVARRYGAFLIPRTRLDAAGIDLEALRHATIGSPISSEIATIAHTLEARSRTALEGVRAEFGELPSEVLPALLPLAMVEPYFTAQNRPGFRHLDEIAEPLPLIRPWRLWRAYRRGHF